MAEGAETKNRPVLVAGAGIAGLAAAIGLAKAGIPSIVLERRSDLAEVGAGIQIGPNGLKVLRRLGAADRLQADAVAPDAVRIRSGTSGKQLAEVPLGRAIEERHGAPYWTVAREDLHRSLRETAGRHGDLMSLRAGQAAASFTAEGPHISLRAEGHDVPLAGRALVIAAGLWGRIGEARIPLVATTKAAARALLPIEHVPTELAGNAVGLWLGPRAHLVHYPVRAGSLLSIVAVTEGESEPETWNAPIDAQLVVSAFRHWASVPRRLVEAVPEWRQWRLYAQAAPAPPLPGTVIRIGDAAGPVFPFLAQGGVLALEDAAAVASSLKSVPDDVGAAFESIRKQRLDRRTAVARASSENGRIYHLEGLPALVRDLVLRASSANALLGRFDWLYGFEP